MGFLQIIFVNFFDIVHIFGSENFNKAYGQIVYCKQKFVKTVLRKYKVKLLLKRCENWRRFLVKNCCDNMYAALYFSLLGTCMSYVLLYFVDARESNVAY